MKFFTHQKNTKEDKALLCAQTTYVGTDNVNSDMAKCHFGASKHLICSEEGTALSGLCTQIFAPFWSMYDRTVVVWQRVA